MSTRRATIATAAATSCGSRESRSTARSPHGSTAPSRSGWSHPRCSPSRRRITPNQVTLIAFAVAVAAAAAFAVGAPIAAAMLVALASVLDGSDGEVARLTHRSSPYGAFLDAVLDRAADGILFTGAAIYLATDSHLGDLLGGAQVPLAVAMSGAALVGHLLVSYTTAKAAIDLGQRYRGALLGGGRGRDLRLSGHRRCPGCGSRSGGPAGGSSGGGAALRLDRRGAAPPGRGGRPGQAPSTRACVPSFSTSTARSPTRWASSRTWPAGCSSPSWASSGPRRPGGTSPRPVRARDPAG